MGRKVGIAVMIFFMLLGVLFFAHGIISGEMSMAFFQVYVGAFAGVYGVFAGADSFVKGSRSKYYRPELDDRHPEIQKTAKRQRERDIER